MTRTSFVASLVVVAGLVTTTVRAEDTARAYVGGEKSAAAQESKHRLIADEKMRNTVTAAVRIPWRVATAPVWVPFYAVSSFAYPSNRDGHPYLDFLLAREGDSRYVLFGRSAIYR